MYHATMQVTEDYKINSKKYKTIGELLKASPRSIKCVCSKLEDKAAKEYIVKLLLPQVKMSGNMTNRIKILNSSCISEYILSNIFNITPHISTQITNIIDKNIANDIITPIYDINPSMCGTFFDYIVRRIIAEIKQEKFEDERMKNQIGFYGYLKKNNENNKNDYIFKKFSFLQYDLSKKMWWFRTNDITYGCIHKYTEPIREESKKCGTIMFGDVFQCILKTDNYMKIIHNAKICYIFSLEYVEELDYYPAHACGYKYLKGNPDNDKSGTAHYNCNYPVCRVESYKKIKDTINYKTKDIIPEIFISSICHSESFIECMQTPTFINMKTFGKMYSIISSEVFLENLTQHIINPLMQYFTNYICNKPVLLNPMLGGMYEYSIPADCDIVIGDALIDIKCTIGDNSSYEIMQLLGYSALLQNNPTYNKRINQISILNLLEGSILFYDTSHISKEQYLSFLKILTQK
jgi:hypothetical protein